MTRAEQTALIESLESSIDAHLNFADRLTDHEMFDDAAMHYRKVHALRRRWFEVMDTETID